jgi:hypothetical protein
VLSIKSQKTYTKITGFLGSDWFFAVLILGFIVEAAWIALTSRFPMAFDESYHLGLIQFFSHHLNPFVSSQPPSYYFVGAIAHNPSILYHYLLSFPYRLIVLITPAMKTQIILLRLINIAMMVASLALFRKILRTCGLSRIFSNLTVFLFAFTPIVCQLAAQINYDNLFILLSSVAIYMTIKLTKDLRGNKFNAKALLSLLALCLISSEVKFAFLPIFAGITIYILFSLYLTSRREAMGLTKLLTNFKKDYQVIQKPLRIGLVTLIVLGAGIFVNYYGVNLVKYRALSPQCNQVLSIKDCENNAVWVRNNKLVLDSSSAPTMNILHYTYNWGRLLFDQLFSAVTPNGGNALSASGFMKALVITIGVVATVGLVAYRSSIAKKFSYFPMASFIVLFYGLCLWAYNYHSYLHLHVFVGVQGRYLLPILIYVYALCALSLRDVLSKRNKSNIVFPSVVTLALLIFLMDGGFTTYRAKISPNQHWISKNTAISNKYIETKV